MKKTFYISRRSEILELMERREQYHIIETTNSTCKITCGTKKYILTDGFLSKRDLIYISNVKNHIERTGKPYTGAIPSHVKYFGVSSTLESGVYNDICEIDVNKAYYTIALKSGYISEELYRRSFSYNKMVRLVALGSVASVTEQRQYTPGEGYEFMGNKSNKTTRSYFFDIARQLSDVMKQCEKVSGYMFFWVDAIFCRKSEAKYVCEIIENNGLEYTNEELQSIYVERRGRYADIIAKKEGGDKRYTIPPYQKKGDVADEQLRRKHLDLINEVNPNQND